MRAYEGPEGAAEAPELGPPEEVHPPTAVSRERDAHCAAVQSLDICNGYVCSAGGDAMIRVWREDTLEFVA